jgi:hypothetical protein
MAVLASRDAYIVRCSSLRSSLQLSVESWLETDNLI